MAWCRPPDQLIAISAELEVICEAAAEGRSDDQFGYMSIHNAEQPNPRIISLRFAWRLLALSPKDVVPHATRDKLRHTSVLQYPTETDDVQKNMKCSPILPPAEIEQNSNKPSKAGLSSSNRTTAQHPSAQFHQSGGTTKEGVVSTMHDESIKRGL